MFLINVALHQLNISFQTIYNTLDQIEVAITLSRLNILHNSLLDPNDLLTEIKKINIFLFKAKLPYEPIMQNLLLFEQILEITSFSSGNKIVFAIKIPIVESSAYDYYRLYPIPVPDHEAFRVIIPLTKYLALNEQHHLVKFECYCIQEINLTAFAYLFK